jgi:Family of unknown function (DUF6504)
MFDKPNSAQNNHVQNNPARVIAPGGEPTEFIYQGHHFHIHAITSRWSESGGWWNRISDGNLHTEVKIDDQPRAVWRVEAAPVGMLATFEIELDEVTGNWRIRPTSRAS